MLVSDATTVKIDGWLVDTSIEIPEGRFAASLCTWTACTECSLIHIAVWER